ncbi:hypothetical protein [Bacillus sp. JJ722]|uniref:hypothetical protein n=1 Tax=Bacillus sp. JJ722 TaxID=3122973 RepID=UPI002FFDB08F
MYLGEQYDCRLYKSGGSTGYYTYKFHVSPPLPDDISGYDLVFKEYRDFLKEQTTGLEIVMHLD